MTFDSKTTCWICLKPYDKHSKEDWKRCTKANELRGKVIDTLTDVLKTNGFNIKKTKMTEIYRGKV